MQLNENCSVTKGWLQKSCRFSILHSLQLRYFVLSDSELRYYKHPTDIQPAGVIELKHFHYVDIQDSTPLYGFKITSEHKNQCTVTLYADNNEERNTWVRRIQASLSKIQSDMIHCYSPQDLLDATGSNQSFSKRRHTIHSHHHHSGMLDRWLDKFDLHDKRDDSHHHINSNISNKHCHRNNRRATTSDVHYYTTRKNTDPPISQSSYDSFASDSVYSDIITHTPHQSMDSIIPSTPSSTLSNNTILKDNILSTSPPNDTNLEIERAIYLSHTSNRRPKSSQFHSAPIIPLSPPPRR